MKRMILEEVRSFMGNGFGNTLWLRTFLFAFWDELCYTDKVFAPETRSEVCGKQAIQRALCVRVRKDSKLI